MTSGIGKDNALGYLDQYKLSKLNLTFWECESSERLDFLLMACVLSSANNDVYALTQIIPALSVSESMKEPQCAYWSIQRYGLAASRMLGRLLRRSEVDITQSRLWKLVDKTYQSEILEKREFKRRKDVGLLSYQQICHMIEKRNTIIACQFAAIAGGSVESDDDYGCVTYYTRWRVKQRNGSSETLVISSYLLSLYLFRLMHFREPSENELKEAASFLDYWWSHPLEPFMNTQEKIRLLFRHS
jgi:hypothetical protein